MSRSEQVERAAKAICRVQLNGGDPCQPAVRWNGTEMEPQEFPAWQDFQDEAVAAIEALALPAEPDPPNLHECPDCHNRFVQPFRCVACGAQRLYDHTLLSALNDVADRDRRIAELEAALRDIRRQVAQAERGTTHYVGCDMDHPLCWIDGVAARALEAPK